MHKKQKGNIFVVKVNKDGNLTLIERGLTESELKLKYPKARKLQSSHRVD